MVMKKVPLSQTNPFLKDPVERRFRLFTTVTSSAAIEGVHLSKEVLEKLQEDWDSTIKPVYAVSSESPR
jgi:hypothetical protein